MEYFSLIFALVKSDLSEFEKFVASKQSFLASGLFTLNETRVF